MQYRVRVAGKLFEGSDHRSLLRMAVAAKKVTSRSEERKQPGIPAPPPADAPTAAA